MESMQTYDDGLQFISNITKCRNKINSINDKIERAHHFLRIKPNDEMWERLLEDDELELKTFQNEEITQTEALMTLEGKLDPDFFKLLLQKLGSELARTMAIPHVEDNLKDEYELSNAITTTVQAIKTKRYEYANLSPDDYKQREIITAQLRYFYNDLSLHPWGVQKINELGVEVQQQPEENVERGR